MPMRNKNLLSLTWPIFIEYILQLLVSNIDKIMVNSISDTAVSSIANAATVLDVTLILFSVISLAIIIMASQYFGNKDYEKISQVYAMGLLITGTISLVLGLSLIILARPIFSLIKVPLECLNDSVIYLQIISAGLVFQGLYNAYVAMFRTQGYMKQSMYVSALVNLINTVLNFFLIFGIGPLPALGVAGAAIASFIARLIGLIILATYFHNNTSVEIKFKSLKPWPNKLFKTMLYVGLPSGGESISYSASQMVILMFVNLMGNNIIRLKSFASMFAVCSYMFASSLSYAAQIIVGHIIGEKDYEAANREVKKTLWISVIVSAIISFILYLGSDLIFGIFLDDPYLLSLAKKIMFIEIFLESSRAVNMTLVRCLQAAGDTIHPTIVGILFMWGVATFGAYFFGISLEWGIIGVWIAMMLDETFRAFIFIHRWHQGKWKTRTLV